ncbi:MAG: hypothetical protein M4579_004055 [Chaenotheca gracillima]|nr:MAG: hypothetical protein M4579_004055 [Chaenotheca gracillima]
MGPQVPRTSFAYRVFTALRGVVLTTPWVIHLCATDIVLSALLPLSFLAPSFTYNVSSRLASLVWLGIQYIFTRVNHAKITVSGDKLPRNESAVVVANHVSWTDFYLIQALAIRAGMLGRCRYFAKQELRWVPFLGWGLWAIGMPLVSRRWLKDQQEMNRVFYGIRNRRLPIWLISYSEAMRFTPERYEEARRWCAANNRPLPKHALYPRTKGFVTTVQQLRQAPQVRAVYDVTLAYSKDGRFLEAPTIWQSLSEPGMSAPAGGPWAFHAHVERFALEDLPESDEGLAQWLEDRWVRKGELLEGFKEKMNRGEDCSDGLD